MPMGNAVVYVGVVKKPEKDLAINQYLQTEDFLVWANQCNQLNAIQSHAVSQSNSLKFSLSITIDLFKYKRNNSTGSMMITLLLYRMQKYVSEGLLENLPEAIRKLQPVETKRKM